LFVLAMDPLLRNIQANQHIKGLQIPINQNESIKIKVLACADDVNVFSKNTNCVRYIFKGSIKPFITMKLTNPTEVNTCIPNNSQLQDILSLETKVVQWILKKSKAAYEPINLAKYTQNTNTKWSETDFIDDLTLFTELLTPITT